MPARQARAAPKAKATPVRVIAILARHGEGDHSRRCESDTGTIEPTPTPVKNLRARRCEEPAVRHDLRRERSVVLLDVGRRSVMLRGERTWV